jgi:hypothetical protein
VNAHSTDTSDAPTSAPATSHGARCAHHDAAAVASCPRCGDHVCTACWDAEETLCARCRPEHGTYELPLEASVRGLLATTRDVLRTPDRVFSRLAPRGRPIRALLFAALAWSMPGAAIVLYSTLRSEEPFDLVMLALSIEAAVIGGVLGVLFLLPQAVALWGLGRLLRPRTFSASVRAASYAQAGVVAIGAAILSMALLPRISFVLPLLALLSFVHHQAVAFGHFLRGRDAASAATRLAGSAVALWWALLLIARIAWIPG